ncbi:MAG: DUF6212 domain-containing protein [Rhizobiaceae bacterium]
MNSATNTSQRKNKTNKRRPLNICYVTAELFGWDVANEYNRAIYGLAQLSATLGDNVTLVWAPLKEARGKISADYEQWLTNELYQNHLIKLELVGGSDDLLPGLEIAEKASVAVHHFLELNEFDAVYFALEGGLAYYPLLGKECGLSHTSTPMLVVGTEPLEWRNEADRTFVASTREVAVSHMERYCAQSCDRLILNSTYLKKWMKAAGWNIPARTEVLTAPLPFSRTEEQKDAVSELANIDELVFVNGFGERFGFQLFCDALDRVAKSQHHPTVTTLGYFGKLGGEHTGGMLLRQARKWPFAVRMLPWISEQDTLRYVRQRNCLVVISNTAANQPALVQQCLNAGLPFVATDVGGISELIDPKKRSRCLSKSEPDLLAARIVACLDQPPSPVPPRKSFEQQRAAWVEHFAAMASGATAYALAKSRSLSATTRPRRRNRAKSPLVTIILVHHNRPGFLTQSLASVRRQDYPNIELIIVDDGSTDPEAVAYLDEVEKSFARKKGWRILREPNRYLGAARNAGIRAAKGEYVLFLDDDNALFDGAVTSYVTAIESSGSDICSAFSKLLYDPNVPATEKKGYIQYFPLGGCLDLALIHNSLGDANAIIRKSVFKKIGFLIEDWGYVAQDWEFFLRAVLAGLKLRIIPKPLYWYRSNPQSMFRSSNWYQTRLPILEVFRKHKFVGAEKAMELFLSQNVSDADRKLQLENLWYDLSGERYRKLAEMDSNSREAVLLLAEIASAENRPDTALALLGQTDNSNFIDRVQKTLEFQPPSDNAIALLAAPFSKWTHLPHAQLRDFTLLSSSTGEQEAFYIGDHNNLFVEAKGTAVTTACLKAGCPSGTLAVSAKIELGEHTSGAAEVLLAVVADGLEIDWNPADTSNTLVEGSSDWFRISRPGTTREVGITLESATSRRRNLLVAVRCLESGNDANSLICIKSISIRRTIPAKSLVRPRLGAPINRQRAISLGEDEFNKANLMTPYRSKLPLLLVDRKGGGLFLRPHKKGPVVATIHDVFPPFAKRVIASVEIAHEESSDFEFGLALFRPENEPNWKKDFESKVISFSGWYRQDARFSLLEVPLELDTRTKTSLSVALAIRLPRGSNPDPANAFFRKISMVWNE